MKLTKLNVKSLKLADLKSELGSGFKKELNIAEYAAVKVKDLTEPKSVKNYGVKNKYTSTKGGSQADLERKREKMFSMGDIVKSSKYGMGKVINKSKQANVLKKLTVSFVASGIMDVYPESLSIVTKRKLRK